MIKLPNFVDMAKSPEEFKESSLHTIGACESYPQPLYPWGLSISLSNDELDKLDLDADCDVGDTIHLFALAKVTSVSKSEMELDGKPISNKRVELQITHIALEDDGEEVEEKAVEPMNKVVRSPYK